MSVNKYEEWYASCHDQDTPQATAYRDAAKRIHQQDGEVEIDENGVVSFSDDGGAYVMAWVWVNAEEIATAEEIVEKEAN